MLSFLILLLGTNQHPPVCLRKRVVMGEDFGVFGGNPTDVPSEWNDCQEILSERNLRQRLQGDELRYKMTKTDAELVEEGGAPLLPIVKIGAFELYPACGLDLLECIGLTATSNNKARRTEKVKAKEKVKQLREEFAPLQSKWLGKYGYKRFVGDWFYADQLSTDSEESAGGFNMKKGGYYPDGSYRESQ